MTLMIIFLRKYYENIVLTMCCVYQLKMYFNKIHITYFPIYFLGCIITPNEVYTFFFSLQNISFKYVFQESIVPSFLSYSFFINNVYVYSKILLPVFLGIERFVGLGVSLVCFFLAWLFVFNILIEVLVLSRESNNFSKCKLQIVL